VKEASGKTTIPSGEKDARVFLEFSEDNIEVYADFFPAAPKGVPLSLIYVRTLIERVNITHGIFWKRIDKIIEECNSSGKPLKKVLIARGDLPVTEENAYFKLDESLRKPAPPKFEEKGQANYRAFSPFVIVQKDQAIAVMHPAIPGVEGKTVHSEPIPFTKIQISSVVPGKNTRSDGQKIYTDAAGQLVISGTVLNVEPVLTLRGAVGYATGDINFPGDVVMEGAVNDGFRVNVGGSLTVRGTLDATDIVVLQNVSIKGGMIGRGRALVKVSGNLDARFIQNCRLACKKIVTVKSEVINSTIYTMEEVIVGEKGSIVGGEIFSFHSLSAGGIGRENSVPVRVHLGSNWTLRQEMENNNNMIRLIHAKKVKVANYLSAGTLSGIQKARVDEMAARLSDELAKCEAKKTELEKRYIIDRCASLSCTGVIAPGTVVDICGIELIIGSPLKRIRLCLDKGSGRIIPIPLVSTE
jgi:uncharacterized protein (DUF342 family)